MTRAIKYTVDVTCQGYVEGWALGPSGPCTVDVVVNGRSVGKADTGIGRLDVGAALPGIPGSGIAGFLYVFREGDLAQADGDARVSLRITADKLTVSTEPITIPTFRPDPGEQTVPRSPLPTSVTAAIVRRSPSLASGDLATDAGASAAVEVLEYLVERGPRPLPGVHRYLGYLRAVHGAAMFAAQYFPKANRRTTGEKDRTSILTGPTEMTAIAHHLFVLADLGVPGALLEFGCYKGYSTSILSTACHLLGRQMDVFDSFEGLPESSSAYYRRGEFAGALSEVTQNVAEFGRPDVVTFHRGFFSDSVPRWKARPAACLWMDVDLELSAIDALAAFPNLDRRGALFSHECGPASFEGQRPIAHRGPDGVVGPIVDAFVATGRQPVGRFLFGHTGVFWDAQEGTPVLPPAPLERILRLAQLSGL